MIFSVKFRRVFRLSFACLICLIIATCLSFRPAIASPAVEEYAQETIDHGISLLKDTSLSGGARQQALRSFLSANFNIKRIGLFALGDAAAAASPQDITDYLSAFEKLTLDTYVSMIGDYGGQQVKVIGSQERAPGDFVLSAQVTDPGAGRSEKPFLVRFRVVSEGGRYSVVDASVQGVWFELSQRDSVQGFLGTNGGSIPKLIDHMNRLAAQISARQ
ncbi:MAG: ABC transporter substrate-binding protein [Alphaproteobacteria bacterium]